MDHRTEQRHELPDLAHVDAGPADAPPPAGPAHREPPMSEQLAIAVVAGGLVLGGVTAVAAGPRLRHWLPAVLVVGLVYGLLIVGADRAIAHQPYGGCAEAWQAPRSTGADHCRDHGWTVRRNFVLGPKTFVHYMNPYRLQPCRTEDSGNCFWNARTMGNGRGDSFIIKGERDGRHRIWWVRFPR